jgi:hypothetical protein
MWFMVFSCDKATGWGQFLNRRFAEHEELLNKMQKVALLSKTLGLSVLFWVH